MNNITFGNEKVGYYETVAGGAGAVSVSSRERYLSSATIVGIFSIQYLLHDTS